ncbi:MAG: hypothetical protein BWK79_15165 [Beggiatoa sp. IS2]|nr:MAG: hypothetical protein BWK79_15165 [Beggiatoa sp. IS2]
MLGLRQKLILSFGGLLIILFTISYQSMTLLAELSLSIDVILKENYRSVIAVQDMKESLERLDSGALFLIVGNTKEGQELIDIYTPRFLDAMKIASTNTMLPREKELTREITTLFTDFQTQISRLSSAETTLAVQQEIYFQSLFPSFMAIKNAADEILQINQQNMVIANQIARDKATRARQQMYWLLTASLVLTFAFLFFIGRTILQPLRRLTLFARQVGAGKLDLTVQVPYKDELGNLADAFNLMVERLRELRRTEQARLLRTQQTTQLAIDNLPDAIVMFSHDGKVELANRNAVELFGLRPQMRVQTCPQPWLLALIESCLAGKPVRAQGYQSAIQITRKEQELSFLPQAEAIRDTTGRLIGVVVVLSEVTLLRKADEVKSGLLATVSHELRAPLASLRMALYVLLQEQIGELNPKQLELTMAARQDADRLYEIIEDLLDLSRLETDTAILDIQPTLVRDLVNPVVERLRATFQEQGVTLRLDIDPATPKVRADNTRIQLVLTNFLENALKHTPSGGTITLQVKPEANQVLFQVSDNGEGIPEIYRNLIFERFFRIPGQKENGAGLGLAISKEIVEAHQGQISYSPLPSGESGSIFRFSLPVKE